MNKIIIATLLFIFSAIFLIFSEKNQNNNTYIKEVKKDNVSKILAGKKATVYKSPACGCCKGYVDFLEKNGVEVEIVDSRNLTKFKQEFEVPISQESCHTTVFEDSYIVEGHVPLKTLEKLFIEKPNIKGIALPNMPIGTPGMEGPKTQTFKTEILTREKEIYDEV